MNHNYPALDVLDAFIALGERDWFPIPAHEGDNAHLLNTAVVALSGMMDDIDPWNEQELRQAAEHGYSLINSDVISVEQWMAEAHLIDLALADWDREMDQKRAAIALSN